MKQIKIFLGLILLVVLVSCNDESYYYNSSRHVVITAELPDAHQTRACLIQKEGSLDMIAQFKDDNISVFAEQDGKTYKINGSDFWGNIPLVISENKKSCTFEFDLREEIDPNRPYKLHGVNNVMTTVIGTISDEESAATAVGSLYREEGLNGVPLYFEVEDGRDISKVEFKHFTAYEILHVTNTSDEPIVFQYGGYEADELWYYYCYQIIFHNGVEIFGNDNYQGNGYGSQTVIAPGETKDFLSCYIPTGKKMVNAKLRASVNGNEIYSSNTKSSDVAIKVGNAYHLYATWNGKELKFGKEDIRETIIYPTSSYQLSEDGKALIKWLGTETEIDMSADPAFDNVERIGCYAFSSNYWAKSIKLSDNVKEIREYAFEVAEVERIYLPKSLTFIGADAFKNSYCLKEVHITDLSAWCNIRFSQAMYNLSCNPLTSAHSLYLNGEKIVNLVIPDDITKIEYGSFSGADIETLTLSDNVTILDDYAFSSCQNLKTIHFGTKLTEIGHRVFINCKSLEEIILPESLEYIGNLVFDLCDNIKKVHIGENLKTVGTAFRCSNLKEFDGSSQNRYYFVKDGILYRNDYSYSSEAKDYYLEHICLAQVPGGREQDSFVVPDFVTVIDESAFLQCKNLSSIVLHSSIKDVSFINLIFSKDEVPNLKSVEVLATTPPSACLLGYGDYNGAYSYALAINPDATLYVPDGCVDLYKAHPYWSKFTTILSLGSGMPSDDGTVIDDDSPEDPFGDD